MMELGRREQNLLGGLGVQLLIIGLMVFAYTQAIRQVKLAGELSGRLQEQLAVAREQVARQGGKSDLAALQAQVADLKAAMASPDDLDKLAGRLEQLARERFGIRTAGVTVSETPTDRISVPLEGQPDLEIRLYALELKGSGSARDVAGLAAAVSDPAFRPLCPLVAMTIREPGAAGRPVELLLRWLTAVSPGAPASVDMSLPPPGAAPDWGWREEPFQSPFSHPNALRIPAAQKPSLKLSGILMEKDIPTCIIDGQVLKPGDRVQEYQVVLITREAVLLEGKGKEFLLRLP